MDTAKIEGYEKFGRSGRRDMGVFGTGFSVSKLYIAATHLLCVDIIFFSERCKRYQFKNIEALWYARTKNWHFYTTLCVLFSIPGFLGLFFIGDDVSVVFIIWLMTAAGFLVVNIRRGPTCRCYVRTAAHIDQLPPINRVKLAAAFFARVGPLIEESQTDIPMSTQAPPLATNTSPSTTPGAAGQAVSMDRDEPLTEKEDI